MSESYTRSTVRQWFDPWLVRHTVHVKKKAASAKSGTLYNFIYFLNFYFNINCTLALVHELVLHVNQRRSSNWPRQYGNWCLARAVSIMLCRFAHELRVLWHYSRRLTFTVNRTSLGACLRCSESVITFLHPRDESTQFCRSLLPLPRCFARSIYAKVENHHPIMTRTLNYQGQRYLFIMFASLPECAVCLIENITGRTGKTRP